MRSAIGLAALALLASTAPAAAQSAWPRTALSGYASVDTIDAGDLDGDGKPDLVVQDDRTLCVYLQTAAGAFPTAPSRRVPMGGAFLWSIAPGPGGRDRIWVQGSGGVAWLGLDGASEPLDPNPTLFRGASSGPALSRRWVADLDADGRSDALRFTPEGKIQILWGTERAALEPGPTLTLRSLRDAGAGGLGGLGLGGAVFVPALYLADFDGDGRLDVAAYWETEIDVYRHAAPRAFAGSPDATRPLMPKRRRHKDRVFEFHRLPEAADIDGDGRTDLATIYPSKGQVFVFLDPLGLGEGFHPTHTIALDGYVTHLWLSDLDGDKRADLTVAGVEKFGVWGGLQILLTRKVDLNVLIFRAGASSPVLGAQPDARETFTVPFSLSLTRDRASLDVPFFPDTRGDFNGDGVRDLLAGDGNDGLGIRLGRKEGGFEPGVWTRVAVPDSESREGTTTYIIDLDRDGKSDLVLHHVDWDKRSHQVEIHLAR